MICKQSVTYVYIHMVFTLPHVRYQEPKHAATKAAKRGRKEESHADKAAKEAEDNAKAIADGEKLIHETK